MADFDETTAEQSKRPKGINALHVPVVAPDGSDQTLQFQWMRMHPSIPIALSSTDASHQSPPPEVQVSRMMKHYRKAQCDKQNGKSDSRDSVLPKSPFLRASGVAVDLCDLFDPPLLSEGYLASHTSAIDTTVGGGLKPNNVRVAPDSLPYNVSVPNGDVSEDTVSEWFILLVDRALAKWRTKVGDASTRSDTGQQSTQSTKTPKFTTVEDIVNALPSHWVADHIRGRAPQLAKADNTSSVCFTLLVLTMLAEEGASEVMGRYILKVLAPSLLYTVNFTETEDSDRYLRRLAAALLVQCSLAKLGKPTLRGLLSPSPGDPDSEVMDELRHYIVETYTQVMAGAGAGKES